LRRYRIVHSSALKNLAADAPPVNMDSGNVFKGLFYGGFASCCAETGEQRPIRRWRSTHGAASHAVLQRSQSPCRSTL